MNHEKAMVVSRGLARLEAEKGAPLTEAEAAGYRNTMAGAAGAVADAGRGAFSKGVAAAAGDVARFRRWAARKMAGGPLACDTLAAHKAASCEALAAALRGLGGGGAWSMTLTPRHGGAVEAHLLHVGLFRKLDPGPGFRRPPARELAKTFPKVISKTVYIGPISGLTEWIEKQKGGTDEEIETHETESQQNGGAQPHGEIDGGKGVADSQGSAANAAHPGEQGPDCEGV